MRRPRVGTLRARAIRRASTWACASREGKLSSPPPSQRREAWPQRAASPLSARESPARAGSCGASLGPHKGQAAGRDAQGDRSRLHDVSKNPRNCGRVRRDVLSRASPKRSRTGSHMGACGAPLRAGLRRALPRFFEGLWLRAKGQCIGHAKGSVPHVLRLSVRNCLERRWHGTCATA